MIWFSFCFPASVSIFQPSSYHIIVHTEFGLKLQIQLAPIMQLYAVVDQSAKGMLQGKPELFIITANDLMS